MSQSHCNSREQLVWPVTIEIDLHILQIATASNPDIFVANPESTLWPSLPSHFWLMLVECVELILRLSR